MSSIKERIVNEATQMFAADGIKAIRMDDIATRMGISKRTIYEIFGDKENLIYECIVCFGKKAEEENKIITANATNIIEEYLLTMECRDQEADANYKIMTSVKKFYPKLYDRLISDHYVEIYTQLKKKLERGVKEGYLLDSINLSLAISVFTYSVYGIIKDEFILPHNVSEREAFKYVTTYFFRGIATQKGIKLIDDYNNRKNKNN